MGGLLVDILALAVVAGFAWAGYTLGLLRSTIRLLSALGAFLIAMLLRNPVSRLVEILTPLEGDVAGLLAVVLVGVGTYFALARIVGYYAAWVPHERLQSRDRALGAVPGALVGIAWVALMVSLLVLIPVDGFVSRSAISSVAGGTIINGSPSALKWLNSAFPRFTQTLPKGQLGATARPREEELHLANVDSDELEPRPEDAGRLLAFINGGRSSRDAEPLTWNPQVAEQLTAHSRRMFEQRFFALEAPDGTSVKDSLLDALGNNADLYDSFAVRIAWAHDSATAYNALVEDERAEKDLFDPRFTEIGIGVVDGGWFNGRMVTIGLVGRPAPDAAAGTGSPSPPPSEPSSGSGGAVPPASTEPAPGSAGADPLAPGGTSPPGGGVDPLAPA